MEKEAAELVGLDKIREKFTESGRSIKHLTRNLRKAGYTLHRVNGRFGRNLYALTKEDAERYLSECNRVVAEEPKSVNIPFRKIEEGVRKRREKDGWISFRLASVGMPDLINLKPVSNGLFEVLFEEVKGPADGLRKEQHAVLESMKQKGVPAVVTWL